MNTKDTYTEVYMGVFMQKNKRKVGAFYEEIAADYLVSQGVMILERNYRNWLGEIDLIGICLLYTSDAADDYLTV